MENEQNLELEQDQIEETGEVVEKPQKKELTPEQELGIKRRSFSRLAEELGVEVEKPWLSKPILNSKTVEKEKTEFSDTEHLLLDVKNVSNEDREWLFKEHKDTGKSLRQLLEFRYVQDELKQKNQQRASQNALPGGNNRTGGGSSDSVDYWLAKIDSKEVSLGQVPDRKIRSEIIKKRLERDKAGNSVFGR